MSGESRLAFHAVPRIMKSANDNEPSNELKSCNNDTNNSIISRKFESDLSQEEWQPFENYLAKTRINVNVRQVHSPGNTVAWRIYVIGKN